METYIIQHYKEMLGIVAIIMTLVGFVPYIKSIYAGKTKPHVFSWVIWGISTFIVFLAQVNDKGGAGTWSIGVSGVITLFIAWLAYYRKGDIGITKGDWVCFITALGTIPLWYVTSNPLWAVIILIAVDLVGFIPTFRKAYIKPFEEQLLLFVIMTVRNIISIMALEHYSLTTILFQAVISAVSIVFIIMVWIRRAHVTDSLGNSTLHP